MQMPADYQIHLLNKASLAAFGEHVYLQHVLRLGYPIQRAAAADHDFCLTILNGELLKIDVKTTCLGKRKYYGYRIADDIVYDLIVVKRDSVFLHPDDLSPLAGFGRICIGNTDRLASQWAALRHAGRKLNSRRVLTAN